MESYALSSSYFAGRGLSPEAMAGQTRALGFSRVELGYYTLETELDGWARAVAAEGLAVGSVHAFCPMAVGMPQLGPELFSLASLEREEREAAIRGTLRAVGCAERFGARAVVMHGGRVALRRPGVLFGSRPYRSQLEQAFRARGGVADVALAGAERGLRAAGAERMLDAISFALERVLPACEAAGVVLAFENLPGLEAFPDPAEVAFLQRRFPTEALGAWYDIGHGERKARVGDWPVEETLALTGRLTVGVHIHDVRGLLEDHRAPGEGAVDFSALLPLLRKRGLIRVFEPAPQVSPEALRRGLALVSQWVGAVGEG